MKKIKQRLLLTYIAVSVVSHAANPPIGVEATIEAKDKDSDSNSGGNRVSSTELDMVDKLLTDRNSEITVTLTTGTVPSGYPKWSGNNLTGNFDGQLTAQWKGSSSETVSVELCPGQKEDIDIKLIAEINQKLTLDFNPGSKFSNFVEKINTGLARLKSDKKLEAGGAAEISSGNVDYWNDGEKIGAKIGGKGSLTATLPEIDVDFDFPTPIPGLEIELEFTAASAGLVLALSGEYDESKSIKGKITGSGNVGVDLRVDVGPEIGSDDIAELDVEIGLQTRLSAEIKVYNEGKVVFYDGHVGLSESKLTIGATVTFWGGEFNVFEEEYNVSALDWNVPIDKTEIFSL